MPTTSNSLSKYLAQALSKDAHGTTLTKLIMEMTKAFKDIATLSSQGALAEATGSLDTINVQGETQKRLDVLSNNVFIETLQVSGCVAGLASEEVDDPVPIQSPYQRGPFLAIFDPLDGSSNIDGNVSVGSIFSILEAPIQGEPVLKDYLKPGTKQVAAGYALYGPATILVLTVGQGTHGFTLDHNTGEFLLTHNNIKIPEKTNEYAINASNARFWEPPVARYIGECNAGKTGPRGRDFNMRWIASMVAEVHRILIRGGIFMYPKDTKDPTKPGRLRLMYEANPMAMVVEQAGGLASTGRKPILEVQPELIHQRVPVVLGSKLEVEQVIRYHQEYDQGIEQFSYPLFHDRGIIQSN